jgi:hypothetical protein
VPHDEWLPDPDWPEPPADWSFWTVTVRPPKPDRSSRGGKASKVSFPVATAAAQSTVSLAALFPERARQTESPTFRDYGSTGGSTPSPGGPVKAGREYYRPRGWATHAEPEPEGKLTEGHLEVGGGSVLNGSGPVRDRFGAPVPELVEAGTAIDPTVVPDRPAGTPEDGPPPGIRLSPILRLVAHQSGLRAQFRVGGPVAAALADVMIPAIEAASGKAAWVGTPEPSSGGRERRGLAGLLRGRKAEQPGSPPSGGGAPHQGAVVRPRTNPLSISDLVRRSTEARRANDPHAAEAVEVALCSLHRHPFAPIRPPNVAPPMPVTPAELAAIQAKAVESAGADEPGLSRAELTQRRALASERAASLVRATNVARRVFADRREALAEGAWSLLGGHDPATVVAVVDEALRLSGSDVTCIDAGVDTAAQRAYVTVLVRYASPIVVADDALERSASGRTVWRARTPAERNSVYAAGLASAVLAAAKQADCIAVAADDVNVVVVRPTRDGRGVEPIYVGTLDREDVSLRHPDADPLPLVAGSAVRHGLRIHGPDREVTALDRAADVNGSLREIVIACRTALAQ